MRRSLVLALVACLAMGALAAPSQAAKKKKKKPKPITFAVEGAFDIGNPADYQAGAGLVRNELELTCAIPASQGTDGFVFELPEALQKVASDASLNGQDATGGPDMDMYFYDEACVSTGDVATTELNEYGIIPEGTKFVVVSAWMGADISFEFEAVEKR